MEPTSSAPPPSREPPENAINVTDDDEGVKKLVVQEGTGEVPALHSRCLVHYVGRIAERDAVFIDTREESTAGEPVKLVAGRDTVQRERGLHLAVASMRRGERAHLWVSPEYGYGSSGSFSFPTVPPAAALTYDIELLDWEPPEEGKEQRDMLFEERVEVAERRRAEGNAAFKKGRYADALGRYRVALSFVDEDLLIQLQGFHYDKAMAARAPALLNMGACHLRLGEFHEAITLMGQVLAIDPGNSKALFRRGAARRALGQTEQAIDDLQAAKRAAPGDGGIARELAAAKADLREERQAAAQVFRGLVDKTDASKGLYGDAGSDGEEREEQQAAAVAGGGMGWLGGVLQALCPFIFGRGKAHAA